jgi:hypothetical protein
LGYAGDLPGAPILSFPASGKSFSSTAAIGTCTRGDALEKRAAVFLRGADPDDKTVCELLAYYCHMPASDPSVIANVVSQFQALLQRPEVIEGEIQTFMEDHSELIPLPHLLGHDLHMGCVISKFELNRCRKPDFAFLTKNTGNWGLVLIELERPQKTLFTQAEHVDFHHETRAAINQIEDWKTGIDENFEHVRRMLMPLLTPPDFRSNPLQVHYLLVIGRNPGGRYTAEQRGRLRRLEDESKVTLITYDSIIRMMEHQTWRVGYTKNILVHHRNSYRLKKAHTASTQMFAWYRPDEIDVPDELIAWFKGHGYDMDAWLKGEQLVLNGKWPKSREQEFYDAIRNASSNRPTLLSSLAKPAQPATPAPASKD